VCSGRIAFSAAKGFCELFTGLVNDIGEISSVGVHGALRRVRVLCSYRSETIALGASIACGGPCLTVVGVGVEGDKTWFEVDVAAETLARTAASNWKPGDRINLERPLKIGDELGGHIVTGHVDGVAEILAIEDFDGMKRFSICAPHHLARFIAEKGSVSLDGTSLTVNDVDGEIFSVLLIPHTLQVTTWGAKKPGDPINLEVDLMARYAARLSESATVSG
jgi:riboflavin synthase